MVHDVQLTSAVELCLLSYYCGNLLCLSGLLADAVTACCNADADANADTECR